MSSVQGEKECPKCGGVMLYDFNCRTIEEHSTCCRCGLRQHWVPLWNEDGSMKRNEDGDCIGDCKETLGYGTAFVVMQNGVGHLYAFDKPRTTAEKEDFMGKIRHDGVAGSSYIVSFDPAAGEMTVLAGECPPDFYPDDTEKG